MQGGSAAERLVLVSAEPFFPCRGVVFSELVSSGRTCGGASEPGKYVEVAQFGGVFRCLVCYGQVCEVGEVGRRLIDRRVADFSPSGHLLS